jgi:hypothetical protein
MNVAVNEFLETLVNDLDARCEHGRFFPSAAPTRGALRAPSPKPRARATRGLSSFVDAC